MDTAADYDVIGIGYRQLRRPDPRIAALVTAALGEARTVVNVGAGAGSYEPADRPVVAVEPSAVMIGQHTGRRRARGLAERLPFADGTFDVAMASLTIHHWPDWRAGIAEMRRVAARQVIFTYDPDDHGEFWLVTDYLPTVNGALHHAPTPNELVDALGGATVQTIPVPHDCTDGFMAAYWRRPERYLEPAVRRAISGFGMLDADVVERSVRALAHDLESGTWHERHGDLLDKTEMDYGYRLVVTE